MTANDSNKCHRCGALITGFTRLYVGGSPYHENCAPVRVNPDDGGPAFPTVTQRVVGAQVVLAADEKGLSLRDYFAAAALTGICVSDKFIRTEENTKGQAVWAYEIADAMLAARKIKP